MKLQNFFILGKILDKLQLQFHCTPAELQMTSKQISLCKKFLRHSQSLVLDWCACEENKVINLLKFPNKESHIIQDICFLSKGPFFGCERDKNAKSDKDAIVKDIVTFLKSCKNVRKIDCGINGELCHNEDIMEVLKEKSDGGKLKNVNMSGHYPSYGVFSIQCEVFERRALFIKKLCRNLTEITVAWDSKFEDLVTTLANSQTTVKTLGLLIDHDEYWDHIKPKTMTLTQLWKLLKVNKPDIEVKMNIEEMYIRYNNDDDLADVRAIFNTEMPLTRLCVVFKSEEFAKLVLQNLRKEKHAPNLKELGLHYVCSIHVKTVPVKDVFHMIQISKLIADLKCLKSLTKISLSGEFLPITDLMSLVTQHAATLQDVHVHKHEVVSEKSLAEEANEEKQMKKKRKKKTKYYDALTDEEIDCIEKIVSKILRKPWRMLKDIPIQRCPIDSMYCYYKHGSVDKEMYYVLQNKAV